METRRETLREGREEAGEPRSAHAVLIAVFVTAVAVGLEASARRGGLPRRVEAADLALLGVATHKATRILSMARVSSPLRAPFAQQVRAAGAGEVTSDPRGRGLRRALGELLTCPYCLAPWTAAAFMLGLLRVPRQTRAIAGLLGVVAVSDFLNQRYARLKSLNE